MLFSKSNTKLGAGIYGFSIPARPSICVGATPACESVCYARGGFFVMDNVRRNHEANLKRTRSPHFVGDALAELRARHIERLRIHVAGDFYSVAYIRKWIDIVRGRDQTVFFGYTRSWRVPALVPAIEELAALPNARIWLSEDRQTGRSPAIPNTRRAFLMVEPGDESLVPEGVELVFREVEDRPLKRVRGSLVCTWEQGIPRQIQLTCAKCRICLR